ncbi:MAG: hypothetical protein MJ169_02795 [Treponema sp.]|nr:hypothetical protein [Treponema sp.]
MEFFVNDQKLDITLENEKTVGEVLKSFEATCEENECATIAIAVNEKNISSEEFEQACSQELKDDTKINVTVVSKAGIEENFRQTSTAMKEIISLLKDIPVDLAAGKNAKANQSIIVLTQVMNNFCTTVTWAGLFPERFKAIEVEGVCLSDFLADFQPILDDFCNALESGDTVLIGDLCEYEISPRLENLAKTLEQI